MNPTLLGLAIAAVLGWAALSHGFGGFVLMAVFLAIGALIGRVMDGRIDVSGVRDALSGRRSSS